MLIKQAHQKRVTFGTTGIFKGTGILNIYYHIATQIINLKSFVLITYYKNGE